MHGLSGTHAANCLLRVPSASTHQQLPASGHCPAAQLSSNICFALMQVRKVQEWDVEQHMRFISSGQELFMDDSVSRAAGSVVHCIASQCPAQKFPAPKSGNAQKGTHSPAVDWVRLDSLSATATWGHVCVQGDQVALPQVYDTGGHLCLVDSQSRFSACGGDDRLAQQRHCP